eukprot:Lithocolla_globosa_v1_NODE_3664_length_1611_cov_4.287918.p2 type:complete len:122 gc:universal NODE_3664_length_1611_cov_4.287918:976-1341(+)
MNSSLSFSFSLSFPPFCSFLPSHCPLLALPFSLLLSLLGSSHYSLAHGHPPREDLVTRQSNALRDIGVLALSWNPFGRFPLNAGLRGRMPSWEKEGLLPGLWSAWYGACTASETTSLTRCH